MRNQNIDQCWQFQHGLYGGFPDPEKAKSIREVNLPHDYMIESEVTKDAAAGPAKGLCGEQNTAAWMWFWASLCSMSSKSIRHTP